MQNKRIGFVGAGNMAGALIKGLLAAHRVRAEQIFASDISTERLTQLQAAHGIGTLSDNSKLVAQSDVVVLAVKPQVLKSVLGSLSSSIRSDTLLISIAAGVPIRTIETGLGVSARVVRAMPNTAAMALAAATAIVAGSHADENDMAVARSIFEAVGRVVALPESLLDAVTGLSGSGPAYVMLIIEALADGGVKAGLPRDVAMPLAAQTVYGAAKLLLETGEHPARLKDMVTSPGGTTIAGVHALEAGAIRGTLMNAVQAATQRSVELGRQAADPGHETKPSPR